MSDYSAENQDMPVNYDDSGHMQTTDTMAAANDEDMPGPGLDIGAKIHLQLCAVNDKLAQQQDDAMAKEQARLAALPRRVSLFKNDGSAAAWRVMNFGGPQLGRQWHVRVAGVSLSSATITSALVYVGPPAMLALIDTTAGPIAAATGLRAVLTPSGGLFAAGQFSAGPLMVTHNEIVVVVVAPTATPNVFANLLIEDEPTGAQQLGPVVDE